MLFSPLKPARHPSSTLGYSLTELAIVLAIIGLVAGITLSAGRVQMDVAEYQGTNERLETLRQALLLFHKKYERYPCPALPADSSTNATYGQEVTGGCTVACPAGLTCASNAVIGVIPFKTLRVNEELAYDSWHGKITYVVDKNHTESSIYNAGDIPIVDAGGNEITASPILGDAFFVLVSHGEDGKGAYGKSGALVAACGATGKDVENCNGDDIFLDSRFIMSDNAASYYDDLIAWQTQESVNPKGCHFPLSAAWESTCAVKSPCSLWCWGRNDVGQLGDGTTTHRSTPVQVSGLTSILGGSLNDMGGCAVKTNGTVWCWGKNAGSSAGRIGDGTTTNRLTPVQVSGLTNVQEAKAGESASCVLKPDGSLWCWGENGNGEVGDGTTFQRLTPVQVAGLSGVTDLGMGDFVTCALKQDGTAWCWGDGEEGQLGNGSTSDRSTPVQVSGLSKVIEIQPEHGSGCAVKVDGTVWCWGLNTQGQLGDGTTTQRLTPVQVSGLSGVTDIATGNSHACAVKNDGTVWCWGKNDEGQLGDGTTTQRLTPVQVSGLTQVEEVSAGDGHSCGKKQDRTLWCWGHNGAGQLGDGTTIQRLTPVQVLNFP